MRRYVFGKYILRIPDDHKIGEIHAQCALYDRSFGFIVEAIAEAHPQGAFIDIGANVGDTAAFLATYAPNAILSVEGSTHFLPYLRLNEPALGKQVTVVEAFVRPSALASQPVTYQTLGGTGNLLATTAEDPTALGDETFLTVTDLIERAKELGREVALIKSDTDGCDGPIVLDALDADPQAVLFFECDTIDRIQSGVDVWPTVFQLLDERGYSVLVFDNFGLPVASVSRGVRDVLSDLSGYIRLQFGMGRVTLYYLDVWAFPPSQRDVFERVSAQMRTEYLRPIT